MTSRAPAVDVAAGIVRAADGRVLIAERTARQIAPGFWEVPGGKVDPGESPRAAAIREVAEEIGIVALAVRPRLVYEHAFPAKRVRFHFFDVLSWKGTPYGREGQRLAWIDPVVGTSLPLSPGHRRLFAGLALPETGWIGPGDVRDATSFLATLARAPGPALVVIDAPQAAPDQRVALARRAAFAVGTGGIVALGGSALEARRAGVAAAFTPAGGVRRLAARPAVDLWIAACTDSAEGAHAAALGADALVTASAADAVFPQHGATLPVYLRAPAGGGASLLRRIHGGDAGAAAAS